MLMISHWYKDLAAWVMSEWFRLTNPQRYAVVLAMLIGMLVLVRFRHLPVSFFRWCCYQLLACTGYRSAITMLMFAVYLVGNGLCMGLQAQGDLAIIASRSGVLSAINMMPLFMIGRSNPLASYLGVPLQLHHFWHHWIGRVSIVQAFIHVILVALSHGHSSRKLTVSGAITAIGLGLIMTFSIIPFRRYLFETFLLIHHSLAVSTTAVLLWHISTIGSPILTNLIFPIISLSVWLIGFVLSLCNWRIRSQDIEIKRYDRVSVIGDNGMTLREVDVLRVDITLNHPMPIRPGQFVYLRIRDFYFRYRFQTHPFMISWWEAEEVNYNLRKDEMPRAKKLTLLIKPASGLTRGLCAESFLDRISFDGPVGQDLRLEQYDNVFLVANGIGLAGVLSYTKYLLDMKSHPVKKCDLNTRKLDLHWELEDNCQEEWGGRFLKELKLQNKNHPLLQVWCYFPSNVKEGGPLFSDDNFKYIYPDPENLSISNKISAVAQKSVGRSIVVACGTSSFTSDFRTTTLETMRFMGKTVDFVETEYRPVNMKLTRTSEVQSARLEKGGFFTFFRRSSRPAEISKPYVRF